MKEYGTDIDVRMMKRSRLNITIEFLLVTFLAFMSFAFGARCARSREVVIILAGMIIVCFLFKVLLASGHRFIWTWAYLSFGLFFWDVLQLISLPVRIAGTISPNTQAFRQMLTEQHQSIKHL